MVVGDDHGHAKPLPTGDLLRRGNAVVAGENGIHPFPVSPLHKLYVQPIAIPDPVRDVAIHLCPKPFQAFQQDVSGVHPVNIIVTDHPDLLSFTYLLPQDIHRPVHIPHQHPVIEIRDGPVEITLHLVLSHNLPVPDEAGQTGTDPKMSSHGLEISAFSQQHPSFHFSLLPFLF